MIYQKHIPQTPLQEYVDHIAYLEGNNKGTGLPKTAMSMVFNMEDSFKLYPNHTFNHPIEYKKHWVAGLQTQPTYVESYGISKMFVVQFKPLGAYIFLPDALNHFTNQYITLDCIYSQEADETWEQLKESKSKSEQFLIVENFLYRKLVSRKFPAPKLISTMDMLFTRSCSFSIQQICDTLYISRKHLNNLTKEYTGVSPKTLSSLYRLQNTLHQISASPTDKLTHVAYDMEYFDQAHFSKDFKRFTNLTPLAYADLTNKKQTLKTIPHFIPS